MKATRALTRAAGRVTRVTARATTAALVEPAGGASTGMRLLGALIVCVIPAVALALGGLIPSLVAAMVAAAVVARRLTLMRGRSWATVTILGHAPRALVTWQGIMAAALVAATVVAAQLRLIPELAIPYAALVAMAVLLLRSRRGYAKNVARVMRVADAAAAALHIPVSELEGRVHRRRDECGRAFIVISNAPARSIDFLRQKPAAVDASLAAVLGDVEASVHGRSIHITPASEETVERRRIVASSDGLIVAVSAPDADGRRELTLAAGTSPTTSERVDAWARRELDGAVLVNWQPHEDSAAVAPMDAAEMHLRARVADALRVHPHEVEVQSTGEPGARSVTITSAALRRLAVGARTSMAVELQRLLPATGDDLEWNPELDDFSGEVRFVERRDPLDVLTPMSAFASAHPLQEDPALAWRRFAVALREDGQPVETSFFHSLTVGQTGAGKGSVLWAMLRGILPAAREGMAEIFAIDPKSAEVIAGDGEHNAVFRQVATEPDQWAALLAELVTRMNARKGKGRKLPVTRELPLIVLMVDEMSALTALDLEAKRAKEVQQNLLLLLSQGRSLNILVIGAVQGPQKEMVGKHRDFMPVRIALRTGTPLETDLVLGEGSADAGALAHLITPATEGNGYRTAGTGWMRIEGQGLTRVRFPYTSDDEIEALHEEFRGLRAAGDLPAQGSDVTPAARLGDVIAGTEVNVDVEDVELNLGDLDLDLGDASPTKPDEWPDVDLDPTPTDKPQRFTW